MLTKGFAQPDYSCLYDDETETFESLDVAGKDVAQICCNNARELLSVRNMGAARCVGFDQSAEFLKQSEELAAITNQELELVCGDFYKIDERFDGTFDIVIITIGVFGWMPDLAAFTEIPVWLLKPVGHIMIHEEHPIVNMFDPVVEKPFEPYFAYFRDQLLQEKGTIIYDGSTADPEINHWWFFHNLADIMNSLIGTGPQIRRYDKYPRNISTTTYDLFQNHTVKTPMSYLLVAQ